MVLEMTDARLAIIQEYRMTIEIDRDPMDEIVIRVRSPCKTADDIYNELIEAE